MHEKNGRAYLMLISSMLIFGTIGIFRKYISLSSGMLAFSRGIIGSAFLFAFVRLRGNRLEKLGGKTLGLLILTGALIGFNWIFLFESYNYTSVATATMCYYMQPTILMILSPLAFREPLTPKKAVCASAAILGMVFVSGVADGKGIRASEFKGIAFGLSAAVLYASVIVLNKKTPVADAYTKTIVQLLTAALVLIPYLLITEDFSAIRISATEALAVAVVGLVHTGFAYAMYFGSMAHLKAQSIAVLSYIDPVSALLLSALILHERLSAFGIVGAVLILGSAFASEMDWKKIGRRANCGIGK